MPRSKSRKASAAPSRAMPSVEAQAKKLATDMMAVRQAAPVPLVPAATRLSRNKFEAVLAKVTPIPAPAPAPAPPNP